MISLVQITDPDIGTGYQVSDYSTYVTDMAGVIIEPREYRVLESPAVVVPAWYTPEVPQPVIQGPETVPQSVTMRQARLALLDSGLLGVVEAALNTLPEPQRTRSLIEWNHGTTVERNSALVSQMSAALELTDTQVDDLFQQANTY